MATSVSGLQTREGAGRSARSGWRRLLAVGAGLVLMATVANVLIAMALRTGLGVPAAFSPLSTPGVASLTIVGMIGATLVFGWVARTQPDPRRTFVVIATAGLILSWLPDLGIRATAVFPGTTTTGIISLMALHVVAAGLAVGTLLRFGLRPE
ncbi:MAG TPA: DUF6069 family protein [Candidatus Acidoferrum sp.]|jgi:hypothetical protein|nr:DUF6069 family protein [Candidatus Acidoferrum sp.]